MNDSEKILQVMKNAGKPLKAGEIAELAKIDKNDVDKVMKKLKSEGKIVSPQRCLWEVK